MLALLLRIIIFNFLKTKSYVAFSAVLWQAILVPALRCTTIDDCSYMEEGKDGEQPSDISPTDHRQDPSVHDGS